MCQALSQPYHQLHPMVLTLLCVRPSCVPSFFYSEPPTLHLALGRDLWPQGGMDQLLSWGTQGLLGVARQSLWAGWQRGPEHAWTVQKGLPVGGRGRGDGMIELGFEECVGDLWRDHLLSSVPGQAAGTDLSTVGLSLPHCEMSTFGRNLLAS